MLLMSLFPPSAEAVHTPTNKEMAGGKYVWDKNVKKIDASSVDFQNIEAETQLSAASLGTCKKAWRQITRMSASPGATETFWNRLSVTWCYKGGDMTYHKWSDSRDISWWAGAVWSYCCETETVRQSINPSEYQYARSEWEWVWQLIWPLPFKVYTYPWVSMTVRSDGTWESDSGGIA
jgi:hypothetical protein